MINRYEPVVILAGGYGSRLGEYTEKIPKPMVRIGNIPILVHIMRLWHKAGFRKFYVAGGYKIKEMITEFNELGFHLSDSETIFLDTGLEAQTAGRLLELRNILTDTFFLSYGDGIISLDLSILKRCHTGDVTATMVVTHPKARFGEVQFGNDWIVKSFSEKPIENKWINAGFFAMEPSIFDYINSPSDILETDIFSKLVKEEELAVLPFEGFWHPMDTPKDVKELNELWNSGDVPWIK